MRRNKRRGAATSAAAGGGGSGFDTAGAGLTSSGTTVNVVANADGSIVVNANDIQVSLATAAPLAVGTAAVGTAAKSAREDHVHAHGNQASSNTMHAVAVASGNAGFMSGADKAKLDGVAASAAALTASAPAQTTKAAAVVGVATDAARSDHKHDVSTAATASSDHTTDAEGAATSLARSDHTHKVPRRYMVGTWRTTNIALSTTVSPVRATGLASTWTAPRACRITRWSSDGGGVTPAGSDLAIKVSINGAADVTIGLLQASDTNGIASKAATGTPAIAAGQTVQLRFVTDGSWSSTSLDPQVDLEIEET